jgi:hypothetical protein
MARPTIVVDSQIWKVFPTGRVTVYGKDEFGLLDLFHQSQPAWTSPEGGYGVR